jgi:hypothetical protein
LLIRVKLKEFFTIGNTVIAGVATSGGVLTDPAVDANWLTHIEGSPSPTINSYWEWQQGTQSSPSSVKYYLPTENKDYTSTAADNVFNRATVYDSTGTPAPFNPGGAADYLNASHVGNLYSRVPDGANPAVFTYETVANSATAYVLTMAEWISLGRAAGDFWVGDTDGWYYWANYLPPKDATGLLLDGVNRKRALTDKYYYGIKTKLEAATFEEVEKFTSIGDGPPSNNAKDLLAIISSNVITKISLPTTIVATNNTLHISTTMSSITIPPGNLIKTYNPLVSTTLRSASAIGNAGVLTAVEGMRYDFIRGPITPTIDQATGMISGLNADGTYVVRISSVLEPSKKLTVRIVRK